jgi:NADPH:quinone reductase
LWGKNALFLYSRLRGRQAAFYGITMLYRKDPQPFREDLTQLFDLLAEKTISPRVAQTFPLLEAREANYEHRARLFVRP